MKREIDEDLVKIENNQEQEECAEKTNSENPAKRQRRNEVEEIRLLIPTRNAGAIIGKGGQNIKKLRTDHEVKVNIGDCQSPERVMSIASTLDTCCAVIKDIIKHLDKEVGDEYDLRMLIHQSLAGCVIGKGGGKIKDLKARIGCRLKIFSNVAPKSSDRVVQIIGTEDQCISCLTNIMELIRSVSYRTTY